MADESEYSIGELAQQACVTPRTIRYYTAEGLLPQPDSRGRYARYSQEHLRRLGQIALLKEQYLPLHIIRERLDAASTAGPEPHPADRALASPLSLSTLSAPEGARPSAPPGVRPAAQLLAEDLEQTTMSSGQQGTQGLQLGSYQFFPNLPESEEASGNSMPAKAERWQRIVLTPSVEIHLREPLGAERRRRLEALIAAARDILSGDDDA